MSIKTTPTFSRESADYTARMHAMQRLKDPERPSPEMVNEAIEKGEPVDVNRVSGEIRVVLEHEWVDETYTVVIAVNPCEVVTTHYGKKHYE